MICFRRALFASALVLTLGLTAVSAQAQGREPGSQNPAYGHGYGPGMMWGGRGEFGPGMMWGRGFGFGTMGGDDGPGMMWGWGGGGWGDDPSTAESFAEGRLAFLKAALKIAPPQEALWRKYADTVRTNTKEMFQRHKTLFESAQANENLPQRLEKREELMALNLDAMRKTDTALKPLYAALDENQKNLADRFIGFQMMPFAGMF